MSVLDTGRDRQDVSFWGLRLSPMDLDAAVHWITGEARARRSRVVITPNINHLHLAGASPDMQASLDAADLQLADGWPIVAASRLFGPGLPERIAGIDLVQRLLANRNRFSVAILGGPEDSARRLAEQAQPHNRVALVDELTPGWEEESRRRELVARVAAAEPDLTLVAIGAPRQERLAHELKVAVRGPIICCGAAVEVLAGVRPRAPRLVQRLRMEWLFRLALEPRRLGGRYLVAGGTFARLFAGSAVRRAVGAGAPAPSGRPRAGRR